MFYDSKKNDLNKKFVECYDNHQNHFTYHFTVIPNFSKTKEMTSTQIENRDTALSSLQLLDSRQCSLEINVRRISIDFICDVILRQRQL